MDKHERSAFARIIGLLFATYGREASAVAIEAYWIALSDLPVDVLEVAAKKALERCRFMPTPAELRDYAGVLRTEQQAELAWASVVDAVKRIGGYQSVDFEDPAVNAAIRAMGGWGRLTSLKGDELHVWAKKDFLAQYDAWGNRLHVGEQGRYLPGLHEQQACGNGTAAAPLPIPAPYTTPEQKGLPNADCVRALTSGSEEV